jgi:mannose-6-phosphate isomerase-like protein (cupin superfamily)
LECKIEELFLDLHGSRKNNIFLCHSQNENKAKTWNRFRVSLEHSMPWNILLANVDALVSNVKMLIVLYWFDHWSAMVVFQFHLKTDEFWIVETDIMVKH